MERLPGLDFLRATAILLVLLLHAESAPVFIRMGWAGVDLFFVLSGFLVSGILFKEYDQFGRINIGRFLIRRGFKIYPMFYILLGAHLVYYWAKGALPATGHIIAELIFIQNYRPGLMGVSWSLAVEEHFYFIMAFLIFVSRYFTIINHRKSIVISTALLIIVCPVLRVLTWSDQGYSGLFINDFPTHLRMDSLASGVMLSYLYHFYQVKFDKFIVSNYKWIILIIGVCLWPVFVFERSSYFIVTIGYSLLALGFTMLTAIFLGFPEIVTWFKTYRITNWISKMLIKIGRISYSIYLSHFLFGAIIINALKSNRIVEIPHFLLVLIYLVVCIFIGFILTRVIEKPALKFRDKRFPALY